MLQTGPVSYSIFRARSSTTATFFFKNVAVGRKNTIYTNLCPFINLDSYQLLTKDSLSQSSQLHVGILESFFHLLVHGLLLALDHNGGAAVQDPLRGPLHHQQVTVIVGIFCFMHGELEDRMIGI